MTPQGDMGSLYLDDPPDGRDGRTGSGGRSQGSVPQRPEAGAGAGPAAGAGATTITAPAASSGSDSDKRVVRIKDDELIVDGMPLAASAYRQARRVSIEVPGQPPSLSPPSSSAGPSSARKDPSPSRHRSPSMGPSTYVFPMRSVFRGRRMERPGSDSDPTTSGAEGSARNTSDGGAGASIRSTYSARSGRTSSTTSGRSSHPAYDGPRARPIPGLAEQKGKDRSTFSTIHSMLEFTSKATPLGGPTFSLTPFDNQLTVPLPPLHQTAVPSGLPSLVQSTSTNSETLAETPAETPSETPAETPSETPRVMDPSFVPQFPAVPLGSVSDASTEQAGSDSDVPLTIDAPTPTLPTYPAPQSVSSSIAHVMASTTGTGVTESSDSPVSAQVTTTEQVATASAGGTGIGSGSGSGSRTAVMGSHMASSGTPRPSSTAHPTRPASSTRARLEAVRKTVQSFVNDQSITTNMLDPNAPTPRSGAYIPDAAALMRLEAMDSEVREGLIKRGAFTNDEDDTEWAFYARSTTSMSIRESVAGMASADEYGSGKEPITTVRYEHIDTGDGHHVLTGREGRILRCEDEPIRTPGAVQGFGVLMVLEERESGRLSVRQVSENSTELLGLSPRYLFRLDCFTRILTPDQADILRDNTRSLADPPSAASVSSGQPSTQPRPLPPPDPPQVFLLSGFGEQGSDDTPQSDLSGGSKSYRRREWTCWVSAHRPRVRAWKKDSKGHKLPPPDLLILEFELEHDKYNPLLPEEVYEVGSPSGPLSSTRFTSPTNGTESDGAVRSRKTTSHGSVPPSVIQASVEASQSTHSLSPNFKAPVTKLPDTSDSGGDSGQSYRSYPVTSSSEALATSGSSGSRAAAGPGILQNANSPRSSLRQTQSPNNSGKSTRAADSGESDLPSNLSSGLKRSGTASSNERHSSVRFSVGGNSLDDEEYERWLNSTTNYAKPLPSLERMRRSGSGSSRRGGRYSDSRQHSRGTRSRVGMLDAFAVLNQISQQMGVTTDLDTLFKIIVGVVHDLTGYHRVMLYRFDDSYNGEVVAELVDPTRDIELFNGLWFPASDIPPQARELYTVNKVRFLYDRSQTTARMVLKDKSDVEHPLDMTQCFLRALSPIHLQYLKNMDVQASLSISVMAFGKLWGLVCCQSVGEYGMRTSFPIRQLLRVLSDTISMNIERLVYAERLSVRRLITSMPADKPVPGYIMSNAEDLLSYFDADAGMLVINDGCKLLGQVEHAHAMLAIAEYLRISQFNGIRTSSCIEVDHPGLILPGSADTESISGLLYVPLTARAGQDFLVFFRKGQLREVRWAGDPYKPKGADPSVQLQPRRSFQMWAEKVHGRARPWTDDQIESAGILALIYGKFIQVWRERQNAMVSSQLTAILLSNTSHAVRTPLSQIINTLELALAGNIDDETRAMLENSHQASRALLFHVHDLLDLTRIEPGNETGFNDPFDLRQTMTDTVRLYQTEANRRGLDFRVTMDDDLPPMVIGDARKIKTIVSNLVANSVKFTEQGFIEVAAHLQRIERTPSIPSSSIRDGGSSYDSPGETGNESSRESIRTTDSGATGTTRAGPPPPGFVAIEIVVSDSGCGIPPDQLEAMFVALEGAEDWTSPNPDGAGLGLGLAVVARITEQLQGQLCVESEVQTGTRFFLTLNMEVFTGELPTAQNSEQLDGVNRAGLNDFDIPALGAGDLLIGTSAANAIAASSQLSGGQQTPPTPLSVEAVTSPSPSHLHSQRRMTPRTNANYSQHLPLLSPDLMRQGQQTMGTLPPKRSPESPGVVHVTERRLSVGAGSFMVRSSDRSPAVGGGPQANYFERRPAASPPTSSLTQRMAATQISPSLEGLPPPIVSPKVFSRSSSAGSSSKSTPGIKRQASPSTLGPHSPTRSKRGPKGDQRLRVLVVEDDLINSQILQRRLRMDRHTVVAVENGQQAVDALAADWDIDAVLMDIQMPIMDGKTAASEIRKQEAQLPAGRAPGINPLLVDKRIPIFAVSASLYENDRAGLARNFDGWLLKPLDFNRVRKLLAALEDRDKRRVEVYSPGHWERGGYFRGASPERTPNGTPLPEPVAKELSN
ncbi:hypothetical protein Q8F55_003604 [Vanrija albida]|uniref:Uncharacterized protein n=1 Tax=Vanrija albida TaxID=181172 RepID=A0ABR3Q4F3_9TREE